MTGSNSFISNEYIILFPFLRWLTRPADSKSCKCLDMLAIVIDIRCESSVTVLSFFKSKFKISRRLVFDNAKKIRSSLFLYFDNLFPFYLAKITFIIYEDTVQPNG